MCRRPSLRILPFSVFAVSVLAVPAGSVHAGGNWLDLAAAFEQKQDDDKSGNTDAVVRPSPPGSAMVPLLGVPWADVVTVAANLDGGYRNTQFYSLGHNSTLFQWDARIELWLPPFRSEFSYGPYVRLAGVTSNRTEVWENAWLARPGVGIQVYPFSTEPFRQPGNVIGWLLGPTRLFAEYNHLHYWGGQPWWRPDRHVRAGAEYWREDGVNKVDKPLWTEIWWGLTWQRVDEWNVHVDNVIFGASARVGARIPNAGILSMFSPYLLAESSLTENREYWWENRMLVGGGIRFAPHINKPRECLTRFVVFVEAVAIGAYYRHSAPSWASVPDYDIRAGISISIGEWFK